MAHFAQLDENNVVMQVIVVGNNDILDENGQESEAKGIAFCKSLLGEHTNWKQTSYNSTFRKHYAGIGYSYSASLDAFIAPKPFNSWVLNESLAVWEAPVPLPADHLQGDPPKLYVWNEDTLNWVESTGAF
jgi:hypothetical protein